MANQVAWPRGEFTVQDLARLNPHMLYLGGSDIALRVKLNKAIEIGLVSMTGRKNGEGKTVLKFMVIAVESKAPC